MAKKLMAFVVSALLLCLSSAVALASSDSAPGEARAAAQRSLSAFIERHQGTPTQWGLTEDSVKKLALGEGYHLVTWNSNQAEKAEAITSFDVDQWVFIANDGGTPALFVYVAYHEGAWVETRIQQLSTELGDSLTSAQRIAHDQGLTVDARPELFEFAPYSFWMLKGAGKVHMYSTLPAANPALKAMGIDKSHVYPAEVILHKLKAMPKSTEDGAGGGGSGSVVTAYGWYAAALAATVALVLGVLLYRQRRKSA